MSIIGFYHLLRAIDEDVALIKSLSKENSHRDLLIQNYKNFIEDIEKARIYGIKSLALIEYYYNPNFLSNLLIINQETEKIILDEISKFSKNTTITAEKILKNNKFEDTVINKVLVEFLFLKSGLMKIINEDQGIYQRL